MCDVYFEVCCSPGKIIWSSEHVDNKEFDNAQWSWNCGNWESRISLSAVCACGLVMERWIGYCILWKNRSYLNTRPTLDLMEGVPRLRLRSVLQFCLNHEQSHTVRQHDKPWKALGQGPVVCGLSGPNQMSRTLHPLSKELFATILGPKKSGHDTCFLFEFYMNIMSICFNFQIYDTALPWLLAVSLISAGCDKESAAEFVFTMCLTCLGATETGPMAFCSCLVKWSAQIPPSLLVDTRSTSYHLCFLRMQTSRVLSRHAKVEWWIVNDSEPGRTHID